MSPNDDPARSLARAEAAFAAHSVREDMRAAFIAHFAPGGVFVRDGWAVARDWLAPRPPPPVVLEWRPAYVEVASSGELGLSTGPWRMTARGDASAPPAHGQFVSIWKRDAHGEWKVEADLGIRHPAPALWEAPTDARRVSRAGPAATSLRDAEAAFARAAQAGGERAAIEAHGAADLRFHRDGSAPGASLAAALASPAIGTSPVRYHVDHWEAAASGDFGYARGRYADAGAPDATRGWFLRAWRLEAGGWRVVLDVVNPKG